MREQTSIKERGYRTRMEPDDTCRMEKRRDCEENQTVTQKEGRERSRKEQPGKTTVAIEIIIAQAGWVVLRRKRGINQFRGLAACDVPSWNRGSGAGITEGAEVEDIFKLRLRSTSNYNASSCAYRRKIQSLASTPLEGP